MDPERPQHKGNSDEVEVATVPTTESNPAYGLAGKDKAAQLLKEADHPVTVTPADNARILRKIDLTILPLLLVVYALQYLDKSTLSYASVFGLLTDAHLHGEQYSWLGSIVYFAQLIMQPLVAYFLVKLPTGKFCGTMVLGWGIVLCGMVAAKNFGGLLATRFLLGAFEASVGKSRTSPHGFKLLTAEAPMFIAITQMWYRRREQTTRVAAWYAMLGVVNMVSSHEQKYMSYLTT